MAERGKAESSGGLSFMPERVGLCYKTMRVKFKAQDRHGKWYEMEVSELFAQCVCHERTP